MVRGVAQSGSAPVLGTGGRRFESCRPDHFSLNHRDVINAVQAALMIHNPSEVLVVDESASKTSMLPPKAAENQGFYVI